jgi:hypothetical protein
MRRGGLFLKGVLAISFVSANSVHGQSLGTEQARESRSKDDLSFVI